MKIEKIMSQTLCWKIIIFEFQALIIRKPAYLVAKALNYKFNLSEL